MTEKEKNRCAATSLALGPKELIFVSARTNKRQHHLSNLPSIFFLRGAVRAPFFGFANVVLVRIEDKIFKISLLIYIYNIC